MHISVKIPKSTQQTKTVKSAKSNQIHSGQSRDIHPILQLQQTIGNQAVQRLLQAKTNHPQSEGLQDVELSSNVNDAIHSSGQTLDPEIRSLMGRRFNHDFSKVRVHTDHRAGESALALNAKAYTVGQDIVFAPGKFLPKSLHGQRLLVHELTHTVQQRGGASQNSDKTIRVSAAQSAVEHEAARNATRLADMSKLRVDVQSSIQLNRADMESSYWFQSGPPRRPSKTESGIEITPKKQVFVDPADISIQLEGLGKITVRFAGLNSDFNNHRPKPEMKKGEDLVIKAISEALADLTGVPDVKASTRAEALAIRRKDEMVRARLKEAYHVLKTKPLNVFIATELTVAEKMSLRSLALRTEQIYVTAADYGNPKKLQAAIRIPLVALVGGEIGIKLGGKKGVQETAAKAFSPEQRKAALLHEILHVFLINRNASANQLWASIRTGIVKGPESIKKQFERVMHYYLLAQEEVFVYNNVGELYSQFSKNRSHYEYFIKAVDIFLLSKSVTSDQVKTIKLKVTSKVWKEKVKWDISFKYPKLVTVSNQDVDTVKGLNALY